MLQILCDQILTDTNFCAHLLPFKNATEDLGALVQNKKQHSDLFIRLRSGAIYAVIILAGSLLGNFATMLMIAVAAGISAYEFYLMLRSDAKLPNELLGIAGAVSYPVSYYFFGTKGAIFITAALIIALFVWYVF